MSSKRRRGQHNPQRRVSAPNVVSMTEHRVRGNVALADAPSPSFAAAKAEGTLGPNAGNLPTNVQSSSAATNYGAWPAPPPGTGKPYPQMPAVSDTTPLLQQMGATGVAIFSGIITSEEYNPDFYWRDGVKIFDQMLRSDGQINAMRMQMELPLRRATWSIEPASDAPIDKEIASFVESCLFHDMTYQTSEGRTLTQKWDDILRHALLSLWYGFAPFEVVWRKEDGFVKWARWLPLLPRTVWRWWVGSDNELVGIQQWTFKNYTYQFVEIPADKLLLFVHRQEGNNYEGLSLLRTAYKHWWYKANFEKIEAIGIERNAVVPAVIYLPNNFTSSDMSYARTVVQNIRANELGGITLPARADGWDLEYPRNQQRYAMQVQPSIQYHDVMIARNVLAQFLNLGSTETGAYALAESQLDAFRQSLQGIAEYIEDVINSDAIRRLVDYNYDGVAVYPKLKCSKIALQDMDRLSKLLTAIPQYLPPSPELSDWLAKEIGLPVAPGSPIQTTNPGSPSTPGARPQNEQRAGDHGDQESKDTQGTPAAQESPAEGAGQAGGGEAGGSGGGASTGLSEAKLLREAVEALLAHDAIERGVQHWQLAGHPPGYSQNRMRNGQWAPGDGGEHAHGGSGGIHGPAGEVHERGARSGGGGSSAKGESKGSTKAPKEDMHARAQRIRAERGLAREVRPEEYERNANGIPKPPAARISHAELVNRFGKERTEPNLRKVDAEVLAASFGEEHLGALLTVHNLDSLRENADELGISHAGTKAELISRITAHVTEGRYTADFGHSGGSRSKGESEAKAATTRAPRAARAAKAATAAPKEPEESMHERSARLQREQGLAREVRPEEKLTLPPGTGVNSPYRMDTPGLLAREWGEHQLGALLTKYHIAELRNMAGKESLSRPFPRSKAELVSALTAHATGGRYSANFGHSGGSSSRSRSSSSGGDRVAARHEAKIAKLRTQLDAAEKEYAAYKKGKGLSEAAAGDDAHALLLREQIDALRAQLDGDGA